MSFHLKWLIARIIMAALAVLVVIALVKGWGPVREHLLTSVLLVPLLVLGTMGLGDMHRHARRNRSA